MLWFWYGLILGVMAATTFWIIFAVATNKPKISEHDKETEHLARLGATTAGLAHEIRNPLSTIGLNAQLLTEGIDELPLDDNATEPLHKRLNTLRREIERLKGILEDFLRYAGQIQISPVETNLVELLDELVDFFLPQANRMSVDLKLIKPAYTIKAEIDESYFKQALLNLMLNASQAMDQLASPMQHTLSLAVVQHVDPDKVEFEIRDNGPGMSEQTCRQIFMPYFSTRPGGAGLGLPITKRIIDAHHGELNVDSRLEKGTVFTIVLPKKQPGAEHETDGSQP
ncbi:MAG: sensor histidine kinase [Planctomycetota bacterium]|jgi:signal transduction histidine kinase